MKKSGAVASLSHILAWLKVHLNLCSAARYSSLVHWKVLTRVKKEVRKPNWIGEQVLIKVYLQFTSRRSSWWSTDAWEFCAPFYCWLPCGKNLMKLLFGGLYIKACQLSLKSSFHLKSLLYRGSTFLMDTLLS